MKLSELFKKDKKKTVVPLRKSVEINPLFYWKNILILMGSILVVAAILSFVVYYMAERGMMVDSKSRNEVQALVLTNFNDSGLAKIISSFEDRATKRKEIINSKVEFSDPSKKPVVKSGVLPVVQNPAR